MSSSVSSPVPLASMFTMTFSKDRTNANAEQRQLTWRLHGHTVSKKWVALMQEVQAESSRIDYESFSISPDNSDPALLISKLQASCAYVREHADEIDNAVSPQDPAPILLDASASVRTKMDLLNRVHAEFETGYNVVIKRRAAGMSTAKLEMDQHLNTINNMVHALQAALNPGNQAQSASVLSNVRATPVVPLEYPEYGLFTMERTFGDLLLSYGITGKSLVHISTDRDIGLLQQFGASAITSQDVITSAWFCWFGRRVGQEAFAQYLQWCVDNQLREKWNINYLDPTLGIGYIPLGRLVREDNELQGKSDKDIIEWISEYTDCMSVTLH